MLNEKLPTAEEIQNLSEKMQRISEQINCREAAIKGFVYEMAANLRNKGHVIEHLDEPTKREIAKITANYPLLFIGVLSQPK